MIRTLYLGEVYTYRATWHYPFVWTLIVLPPTLIIAMTAALFDVHRRWVVGFALLNMAVLYAALLLPSAPMHDGTRLFLPAFAFLAVLVGVGYCFLTECARRFLSSHPAASSPALAVLVGLLLFVPAAGAVVRTHPYQLSYFNFLIGGIQGAERRGLEVTNMKEVLNREVLRDLAAVIPKDATIDAGFLLEEVCFYRFLELVPRGWKINTNWLAPDRTEVGPILVCADSAAPGIEAVDRRPGDADYLFVLNRKALWRPLERALYEAQESPFYRVALDGIPLFSVYRLQ